MPRIPVRTTPYHTLPRCTRHYKSKRDLILRALGKASFINGSQYVVAWISPKGEVDYYASELLQPSATAKEGGVLNKKEFEREAARVKTEVSRRWDELRVLSERGQAPAMEDDEAEGEPAEEEEEGEEEDPDKTLVDETPETTLDLKKAAPVAVSLPQAQQQAQQMMSTFSAAKAAAAPGPPMHPLNLSLDKIDEYYMSRFADLQQQCCKLVVKAWIKVIEPKKQMNYPYNKGEEAKPKWWPAGVRHREPDHLGKTERLILLSSVFRSGIAPIARLELSTAEAGAHIPPERLPILREIYLVGKEEERHRNEASPATEIVVQLPAAPVTPPTESPESTSTHRRSFDQIDKENGAHQIHLPPQKRLKPSHPYAAARLGPLVTSHPNYYDQAYGYPAQWRDAGHNPHLSPYPSEVGYSGGSDYGRSPNPEVAAAEQQHRAAAFAAGHPNHLAPILNHAHSHSPQDSPAFPQNATLAHGHPPQGPPSVSSAIYPRNPGQNVMQQQQIEFLQAHGHYDYGNPYIADHPWEGGFAQTSS